MENKQEEQLIIIGNGFDLASGLKSTYSSYFDWLYSGSNSFLETRDESYMNYWLDLFSVNYNQRNNPDWSNIEKIILDELKRIDQSYDEYYFENFMQTTEIFDKTFKQRLAQLNSTRSNLLMKKRISKDEFFSVLLNDLNKLENLFSQYMEIELNQNNSYVDKANQLISEIIVKEYIDRPKGYLPSNSQYYEKRNKFVETKRSKTQILSFNYTHETTDASFVNADVYSNVHGEIWSKDIIFGVDGHNLSVSPLLVPFSKTYRLLNRNNKEFSLNSNLAKIKFYGHGLAEPDYSYFQTIFDSINLYRNETKLFFYYTVYDHSIENIIKSTYTKSVYKLITQYGKTLDNKDHGKNMLHKLIIENRIQIKELRTHFLDHYDVV